jgi:SAM-dependent methyltransferase
MSGVTVMAAPPASAPRAGLELVHTPCPLCRGDEAEPVAVGDDSACGVTRDSFLVVSCTACGLLYLNPRPAVEEQTRLYPPAYFEPSASARGSRERPARGAVREGLRQCAPGPIAARILEVGYGARLHLDLLRQVAGPDCLVEALTPHVSLVEPARARGFTAYHGRSQALRGHAAAYDLVFLLHSLEHCDSPVEELQALRQLLRAGGRLVILTPNPESRVGRRFRGRHWAGYDFPRHPVLFGPSALRRLATTTGFDVERLGSLGDARMWADSADNLLRDWGAPAWLRPAASGGLLALGGLASLLQRSGHQGTSRPQLLAVLRKAGEGQT